MGTLSKAADLYKTYKQVKKASDYYKLSKQALDEDTRSGALFKGGIKVTMDLAKRVLGTSLTSHPYFTYHKAHFEVLAQALDASSMQGMAKDAFATAVAAADSTASVGASLQTLRQRASLLSFTWNAKLVEPMRMLVRPASTTIKPADAGFTPQSLTTFVDTTLGDFRHDWWALFEDALELSIMVDAEARTAAEAYTRYQQKMKSLSQGSEFGRIAGAAAEQDRQWQIFDRMTKSGGGSAAAVQDPVAYAERQYMAADSAARRYAQACDLAQGDAVNDPDTFFMKLNAALAS